MSRRANRIFLLALLILGADAAHAADRADFRAIEWLHGEAAREQIAASEGVVLVDLYAEF